jgi:UPF0716 family protein affecting phage T7 exclusion
MASGLHTHTLIGLTRHPGVEHVPKVDAAVRDGQMSVQNIMDSTSLLAA